jgi:predicted 3-demethylubiquinone-9 3-methyltransferase (glyoxalase superfamily)
VGRATNLPGGQFDSRGGEIFMPKITTFLAFNDQAEEAVNFYVSIFNNSKIVSLTRSGAEVPGTNGTFLHATFQLEGQQFQAINGGPYFSFAQGISLFVSCETQEEVDELWDKLSEGGEIQQCGWLKDKFGLSWQIIPTALGKMMSDKDPEKSKRVREAMLKMVKLDIAGLQKAYEGQ